MKSDTDSSVMPFKKAGLLFLSLAFASIAISGYGYYNFLNADYFVYGWQNWEEWSSYAGYTVSEFVWLVFATYFLVLGVIFLMIFASHSYNNVPNHHPIKAPLYAGLGLWFVAATIESYLMAQNVLSCLIYFCINAPDLSPNTSSGANFVYTTYFFLCVFFSFLFWYLFTLSFYWGYYPPKGYSGVFSKEEEESEESTTLLSHNKTVSYGQPLNTEIEAYRSTRTGKLSQAKQAAVVAAVLLALYPLLFTACTLLPTWWNSFQSASIVSYQASIPGETQEDGGGTYWYIVDGDVVFKLFPDILMFYGFIYLVACTALVALFSTPVRRFLLSRPPALRTFSVGQVLLAISIVALAVGQFLYFFYDHAYEGIPDAYLTSAEIAARSMGQVANLLVGLLLLPQAKNSVWTTIFGMSWDEMLIWHQVLGYALILVVLTHMFLWWVVYEQQGDFPQSVFNVPEDYYEDDFTVPLMQLTFFISLIFLGILTLNQIRRYNYELFYYSHVCFVYILVFVMLWHATMSWYYVVGGIVLLAVDAAIRLMNTVCSVVVVADLSVSVTESAPGAGPLDSGFRLWGGAPPRVKGEIPRQGVVRLAYQIKSEPLDARVDMGDEKEDAFASAKATDPQALRHQMGQYCWINVPEIDPLSWHPFTISSAPVDTITTHHIKSMGGSQWTGELYRLASDLAQDPTGLKRIKVNIDGPYGVPLHVPRYEHILLVAGGIGITPIHSTIRQLYLNCKATWEGSVRKGAYPHLKSVRLLWTTRNLSEAAIFSDTLEMIAKDSLDSVFSAKVFITGEAEPSYEQGGVEKPKFDHVFTRPNVVEEINDLSDHGPNAVVFVCGPMPLVDECAEQTTKIQVDFKTEVFLF